MRAFFATLLLASVLAPACALVGPRKDPCPFGYGANCGGGGAISSATKGQVANILEGILKNLNNHKALVQGHSKVASTVVAVEAASSGEWAAPVGKAMQSLLSETTGDTRQAVVAAIAADAPAAACTYFGACDNSVRPIDSQTKAQVASILEGILSNLSKQK
mmetsp:Transcript_83506/g.239904  ORF Transcript_83506/g.239904 Transcript_83506/m.239904 type:complete len:162 (-) Transcript_83506:98-583(-)